MIAARVLFLSYMVVCLLAQSIAVSAVEPGHAKPHKVAQPQAFYIAWGDDGAERSFIVIEPGDALRRPVIVATIQSQTGKLRVVYAGTAFRDKEGTIHIDCRRSIISGPERKRWSPDSFSIDSNGKVQCIDDAQRTSSGRVITWAVSNKKMLIGAAMAKHVHKNMSYGAMRLQARVHLEGVL